jgi:hypothetical protein
LSLVETTLFSSLIHRCLGDDECPALQRAPVTNPEAGDVIREFGGVRTSTRA